MREAINKKGEDLKRYTKEEKAEIFKEVESLCNGESCCQETLYAFHNNSELDKKGFE